VEPAGRRVEGRYPLEAAAKLTRENSRERGVEGHHRGDRRARGRRDGDRLDRARERPGLGGERRTDARPSVAIPEPLHLELGHRKQVVELGAALVQHVGCALDADVRMIAS